MRPPTGPLRWVLVGLGVIGFGVLCALVKGPSDHTLRGTVGNISTPWLLVALLPAALVRGRPLGAAVGLAATWLALLAFYMTVARSLDPAVVAHTVFLNRHWCEAGCVSGPLLGVVATSLPRRALTTLTAALLVAEPVVLVLGARVPAVRAHILWDVRPDAYAAELALGVALAVLVARRRATRWRAER